MAYNVLKGTVEGSVDQHGDQEIKGRKTFRDPVTAFEFYDINSDSKVATLKDVAITKINGGAKNSILTYDEDTTVIARYNLTFDGTTLRTKNLFSEALTGSATGLYHLPVNQFIDTIKADSIEHGPGLQNVRGTLQLKPTQGLLANEEGIGVCLGPVCGLSIRSGQLIVDPTKSKKINDGGQNLSDDDILLVADVSRATTNSTTLSNLYKNYIDVKMDHPCGSPDEIQLKGKTGFASSPNFAYDTAKDVLKIEGKTSTLNMEVENSFTCHGSVVKNIKTILCETYDVEDDDYTILCNSVNNHITVILPPACNNPGRVLVVKKTNEHRYSLKSFPVSIKVEEGTIDINDKIVMKMNYSSRILQSDGKNWWVIGTKGT
jgi:hypothetical protein